jgi:hypothetical protein
MKRRSCGGDLRFDFLIREPVPDDDIASVKIMQYSWIRSSTRIMMVIHF